MPAGKLTLYKPKRKYTRRNRGVTASKEPIPQAMQPAPNKLGALVKIIRKVVGQEAETKQAYSQTGTTLLKFNSGITAVGDMIQILPNIAQGVAENQRIGNQIRAKSLKVKGFVKLDLNDLPDVSSLPNVIVRMMIVSMKTCPSFGDAQGQAPKLGTLLKKGGTTSAFEGYLQDIYAPINTDVFTVHSDKRFYLSQSFLNAQGTLPPSNYVAQDISKTVKFFNINVKCKNKLLKYDEDVNADVGPSNFAPFLLLGYAFLDGSSPDIVSTRVGLNIDTIFNYEDA